MTWPTNGSTYNVSADISLSATASDDESVTQVQFYANSDFLGLGTGPFLTNGLLEGVDGTNEIFGWELNGNAYCRNWSEWQLVFENWTDIFSGTCYQVISNILPEGQYRLDVEAMADSNYNGTAFMELLWYDAGPSLLRTDSQLLSLTGAKTPFTLGYTSAPSAAASLRVMLRSEGGWTSNDMYAGNCVKFYNARLSGPYVYSWENVDEGAYNLAAFAVDNKGAGAWSEAVAISVHDTNNPLPDVSIIAPTNNWICNYPDDIMIQAEASDDGYVSRVEFFQGGDSLGTDATSPYRVTWTNPPEGQYTLMAVATDDKGAIAESASINISVVDTNNTRPVVDLTQPTNAAVLGAGQDVVIMATATDNVAVAQVEFYRDAFSLGVCTTQPYTVIWSNAMEGVYSLTAIVMDNTGKQGTSDVVNISVTDTNPPAAVELKLQYVANDTNTGNEKCEPHIKVVNLGTNAVNLADLKIRYWYSFRDSQSQYYWCDWSSIGENNVEGSFRAMTATNSQADCYLEIGFLSSAGTLQPGENVKTSNRFSKEDFSNYDESDDYS